VPGIEKIFRDILENILYIRPRTKEFLIGYPFLFLAAARYLRGEKKWLWFLAALGAIAPISVFNAFSHIHTPIMVSMIRTVNGLVLGIIFGWIVVAIANRFYNK
jgi:predicted lysophospholipase L1 biosynthesis ABC-type transport system permease subunit